MGATKPLSEWIQDMEKHGMTLCKDKGLVVITVVGKDTTSSSKMADLNEALGACYSWGCCGSIEVFFSIELGALFLVVNTYQDVATFSSLSVASNKDFFQWIDKEEMKMESQLVVALSLSHIVLFIENSCRVELTLLQLLQNVNRKRMDLNDFFTEEESETEDRRFAVPRFLFSFHRHLIRKELSNTKRRELLEKLERCLEDQTFTLFKHYNLLAGGADSPTEEALGHIWGEGYIHLAEKTNDLCSDHLIKKIFSVLEGENVEKEETDYTSNRLFSFLQSHVKKVREGKKLVKEIPSSERFMMMAKEWMEKIDEFEKTEERNDFIEKLTALQIEKAKEMYMPAGSNLVLSRVEHEERMASVIESLSSIQVSPIDISSLKSSFESIWSSHLRSCEFRSLMGNACRLAAHANIGDGVDREKWTLHTSTVSTISGCNCGRSQLTRPDPFTVKEANCDFYSQFSCCGRVMETHEFKLISSSESRKVEMLEEEWPEARIVGQIGERSNEEKREEEGEDKEEEDADESDDGVDREEEEEKNQSSQNESTGYDKNYLETGDLVVKTAKDIQLAKAIQDYDTKCRLESEEVAFIKGVPYMDSPTHVYPLFPSWSLICVGTSSLYSHGSGIRGQFGFIGDTHLLPLDVFLEVDASTWYRDMGYVESVIKSANSSNRSKRMRKGMMNERVKLFIGMEYECSAGHRQLETGPMSDGIHLVENDLPLYQPCAYRKNPCGNAQLMRIHIVTPKAPVTVSINPKIIPSASSSVFYPGESLDLSWSRYYILRLPLIYSGPEGIILPPQSIEHSGLLLSNSITVSYTPLSNW